MPARRFSPDTPDFFLGRFLLLAPSLPANSFVEFSWWVRGSAAGFLLCGWKTIGESAGSSTHTGLHWGRGRLAEATTPSPSFSNSNLLLLRHPPEISSRYFERIFHLYFHLDIRMFNQIILLPSGGAKTPSLILQPHPTSSGSFIQIFRLDISSQYLDIHPDGSILSSIQMSCMID